MPNTYRILVLPGDHVGPEVMKEAVKVLETIEAKRPSKIKFQLLHEMAGGCSMDSRGTPITDEVLRIAKEDVDAVLFGSVGGPEWCVWSIALKVLPFRHGSVTLVKKSYGMR